MNNQLPPHGPSGLDREREIEEQHMRERQNIRQQEELAARAREHSERERQHREYQSLPHQNNTGAIPIHQPVASRLPGAIHSPGGLLANHGGSSSSGPLGAPAGPGNAFGGPLHPGEPRPMQHLNQPGAPGQAQPSMFAPGMVSHGGPNASSSLGVPGGPPVIGGSAALQQQQQQQDVTARSMQQMPFGGAPHQIPGNAAAALGQGQQPILNVSHNLSVVKCCAVRPVGEPLVDGAAHILNFWKICCSGELCDLCKDTKALSWSDAFVGTVLASHPCVSLAINKFFAGSVTR